MVEFTGQFMCSRHVFVGKCILTSVFHIRITSFQVNYIVLLPEARMRVVRLSARYVVLIQFSLVVATGRQIFLFFYDFSFRKVRITAL
jgi:hypothetical protein